MDIDRIQSGDDFVKAIKAVLDQTGAVLVVMGRIWNLADVTGKRRLDDQEDYVRLEIMTALSEDIQVIPVLVQGAEMPKKEDLPPELRSLLQFNAAVLADERWGWDTQRLAKILELDVPGSL